MLGDSNITHSSQAEIDMTCTKYNHTCVINFWLNMINFKN